MKRSLFLVMLVAGLQACAPISRITLLPDAEGSATAVQVQSASGVVDLTQPYQSAALERDGRLQSQQRTAADVQTTHGALLALSLAPAVRLRLEFEPGTSSLTPESLGLLPGILDQASRRSGGEILVVGHTDRTGSPQANDVLSLQRAQAVRGLLIQSGFEAALVDAIGRGDREPLVPTEPNTPEPRNRRADIIIR